MREDEQLVKMANQIAANFSFHDDPVEGVSDHLRRFWAPSMQERLHDLHAAGGNGLHAVVGEAIGRLKVGQ